MSVSPSQSVSTQPRPKSDLSPSPSNVMHTRWRTHTIKQLKLVLPGAALTYYLGTIHVFLSILHGAGGFWARTGAIAASVFGFVTISLFSYILVLHWFTGQKINYKAWRNSGVLSSVIPALTSSIVIGWLIAVSTLGQWSSLGYVKGVIGVSAFYALTFGLLGLVPTRRLSSGKKRH